MIIKVRTSERESLAEIPIQDISTVFFYVSGQCFRIKEIGGELHVSSEDGFLEVFPVAANAIRLQEYHG